MEADSPTDASLTDFFYADRRRLQTFLSQLFPEGNLTAAKVTSKKSSSYTGKGAGHVPLVADFETQGTKLAEDAIERHFDAEWSAPLNFLAEVAERRMLMEDLSHARLGQLVLLRANLQIVDFGTLNMLWKPVHQLLLAQEEDNYKMATNREQRRGGVNAKFADALKKKERESTATGDILSALPSLVQLKCFTESTEAWGTLNPDFMLSSSSELAFKHGKGLPGTWTVVGILDALPDVENPAPINGNSDIENGLLQTMEAIRRGLGRRHSAYGITPLLIYRPVLGD